MKQIMQGQKVVLEDSRTLQLSSVESTTTSNGSTVEQEAYADYK